MILNTMLAKKVLLQAAYFLLAPYYMLAVFFQGLGQLCVILSVVGGTALIYMIILLTQLGVLGWIIAAGSWVLFYGTGRVFEHDRKKPAPKPPAEPTTQQ